jgi:type IV pilus assembly protein PilB
VEKGIQSTPKVEGKRKLGDILIEAGLLTRDQLKTVLLEQMKSGKRLGELLIDLKFVSESQLAYCLASQAGILFVDPTTIQIGPELFQLIPEDLAKRHLAVPLQIKDDKLLVAMVDPLDYESINDLRFHTGIDIQPVVAARREILETIDQNYHLTASIEQVIKTSEKELGGMMVQPMPDQAEFFFAGESGLMEELNRQELMGQLMTYILTKAIIAHASDIHIEPGKNRVWVRFRLDGILKDELKLPKGVQYALMSKVKGLAKLKGAEQKLPQDGTARVMLGETPYDLRICILPAIQGEKATIRILEHSRIAYEFDQLGFSARDIKTIQYMLRKRKGLILVAGPTGTGKTTTLYRMIKDHRGKGNSVTTVEDPVEYNIDGLNQIQIDPENGLTYATALKAILQHDPNVILLGEIRDLETAEAALRTAMRGYLVFSSMPTNDAISAITLMVNFGIPRYLVASALIGVIGQRLVRVLCPSCKVGMKSDPAKPPTSEGAQSKASGCKECNYTGYKGRQGIFEIIPFSSKLRDLLTGGANESELRSTAAAMGISTIYEDGIAKVKEGLTTVEEVSRVIEIDDIERTHCPQCRRFIQADFLICPHCGSPSPYVCGSCGKPQQRGWALCPYCRSSNSETRAPR